ncbi:MAG: hypothetical protein WC238_06180 [Parcubacteria group bacterium]|jgi:hypothetical protein
MPSFTAEIEFEVYCGTCGEGLCNQSDTRASRGRSYPQVTVEVCPKCMKAKEDEIDSLKEEVGRLQTELWDIQNKDR